MRKLIVVALVVIAFGLTAMAQDAPKAEVFGGYQFTSIDINEAGLGDDRLNLHGWNAAVSGYFNNNFGITADFSGAYGSPDILGIGVDTSAHTYMFGPTVRFPSERVTPYVHALFGGAKAKITVLGIEASESGFSMAFGGGIDVKATEHVAVRVGQFDYMYSKLGDAADAQNNFRYSAGIVFRF